jgi:hypothetical protein
MKSIRLVIIGKQKANKAKATPNTVWQQLAADRQTHTSQFNQFIPAPSLSFYFYLAPTTYRLIMRMSKRQSDSLVCQ